MKPQISLRKALSDKNLLGRLIDGPTWKTWRTLLIASMGESLIDQERAIFTTVTGRDCEPGNPVTELLGVIGRRGGKSRAISVLATYVAGLCKHNLVPGERGVLLIIAADKSQAEVCLNYIEAAFRLSPMLSQLVETRIAHALRLTNKIDIEVRGGDFRRLRGPTYIAVIGDEVAFWRNDDSSNPDVEILNAVRPGLATTGGPLFLISSPYARRGVLFDTYSKHYGAQGDPSILVAQGASRTFNPSLSQSIVDRALERDNASACAEYLAQFRTDVESFVSREVVDAATPPRRYEVPLIEGVTYHAFADPSGGSADSMTLAITHAEGDRVILDLVRERKPPFNPDEVVQEFAQTLKDYRLSSVKGDRYAGIWPRQRFAVYDINYVVADQSKSDLYQLLLPILNSGRAELLDHKRLIGQLCALERRTARGGRDSIDHPPGLHDDLANAVAGAIVLAATKKRAEAPIVVPIIVSNGPSIIPGSDTRVIAGTRTAKPTAPWAPFLAADPGRWG